MVEKNPILEKSSRRPPKKILGFVGPVLPLWLTTGEWTQWVDREQSPPLLAYRDPTATWG